MSFFPEQTIRYKTTIKRTLVDGLTQVFQNHPDSMVHKTKVSIEYPKTQADYPAIVVRLYERDIFNAGVGHEEVIYLTGESASTEVTVDLAQTGAIRLNWPSVAFASSYNVYHGTASNQEKEVYSTSTSSFLDTGSSGQVTALPTEVTATFDPPVVSSVVTPGGTRRPGPHYYRVTALGPSTAVKFRHYFYTADIEVAVYALTSLDRDLVADTIVQTLTMGTLENWTNSFYERVYPHNTDLFPDNNFNFIAINSDKIQGFGETQMQTPWGAEDDLMYMTSYRFGVFGEIYSLPPDLTYEMIGQVLQYPYIDGIEPQPQGQPNDGWVSNDWPLA